MYQVNSDRMRDMLALSDLKRWNVIPTVKDQTLAQHLFRVAVIAREIAEMVKENTPELNMYVVLSWALDHDGPECLTGDLPSNFKRELKASGTNLDSIEYDLCPWYQIEHGKTSGLEREIVGVADSIEAAAWLSQFGAPGTRELVDELKLRAHRRAMDAKIEGEAMAVATKVWNHTFSILYKDRRGVNGG